MAGKEHTIIRPRWTGAIVLSMCMHLLLIMTCLYWKDRFVQENINPGMNDGIAFEFIQENMLPKTVIETVNASKIAPEYPDFLSDHHSIAYNPEILQKERSDMPYAQGQVEMGSIQPLPELLESIDADHLLTENNQNETIAEGIHVQKQSPSQPAMNFSRDQLLGIIKPSQNRIPEPAYKELKSSVEQAGGISFNTYAWEYAPYLLRLKERIQKNIYPPASFTRLGFGGSHLIRFRILRDGSITHLIILGHEGDKVLTDTSVNALQLSNPFWPLPDNFPESYLEVTALFRYFGKESY